MTFMHTHTPDEKGLVKETYTQ